MQRLALERGKAVAAEAFSLLSSNLQGALATGGVTNALPYCSLAASPLTASVAERQGVELRRVTHKPRNPAGKADQVESAVLENWRAELQSGKAPDPVVTNLGPGRVTFLGPIVINTPLCLKCHGEPGADIAAPDLALIKKTFPQDQAVGFKLGDLRGAWRIDIPVRELVPQKRTN